jgi:glycosyltransferase involved in cell wall biosynthesis
VSTNPRSPTIDISGAGENNPLLGSQSRFGRRFRVMYILKNYPQISETYIKTELEAVREICDVRIIATKRANMPAKNHEPYRYIEDEAMICEAIREFQPHVLHSHWFHSVKLLGKLARKTGVPFTVRGHSFDSIWPEDKSRFRHFPLLSVFARPSHIRRAVKFIQDEFCLGLLTLPFARPRLERAGFPAAKLVDCFPVVNFRRFFDPRPNGGAIMNVGACIPKKRMEDFVELALRAPELEFNLYALGYKIAELQEFASARQSPVRFIPPVELEDMPAEYKKHRWLVYTAAPGGNVGWPMAIAEAQASGVGVCVANIRADLREYAGPAAFLYDSLDEVVKLIRQPVPEQSRQSGFEQAKKSDVFQHRSLLFHLWRMPQPACEKITAPAAVG